MATFGRELQAVAYLILGSRADAEEIVIDTVMTAWHRSSELRDPAALRSWLLRISTRQAISRKRRIETALLTLSEDEHLLPSEPAPSIDRVAMLDALAGLPREMRAAVVLHYFADLTVEDTAGALGKSRNTIKAQIREGLRRLRSALDVGAPGERAGD